MDTDILFQSESLDGRRVAVVTSLKHLDGSQEFQVDLYIVEPAKFIFQNFSKT